MHDTLGREQIKKRGDGKRIQNFLGQVDHFCIVMIWVKSPTTTPRRLAGWPAEPFDSRLTLRCRFEFLSLSLSHFRFSQMHSSPFKERAPYLS